MSARWCWLRSARAATAACNAASLSRSSGWKAIRCSLRSAHAACVAGGAAAILGDMGADPVADAFAAARTDERLVLLEGFHALKHALRFGAEVVAAATRDRAALERLAERLAPDVRRALAAVVAERPLEALVARVPHTGVAAVARRPPLDSGALLGAAPGPPVVLLEDPRRLGNVGAVVRVAAAAGAAARADHRLGRPLGPGGAARLRRAALRAPGRARRSRRAG